MSRYFWPTSWILLKQYIYSSRPHGLWVNSPFGLWPQGLLTQSPFGLEESFKLIWRWIKSSQHFPCFTCEIGNMALINIVITFTNSNLTCSYFLFRVCYLLKSLENPHIKFLILKVGKYMYASQTCYDFSSPWMLLNLNFITKNQHKPSKCYMQ